MLNVSTQTNPVPRYKKAPILNEKGCIVLKKGDVYGYLTAILPLTVLIQNRTTYLFRCQCGLFVAYMAKMVTSGGAKSCGCRRYWGNRRTHGHRVACKNSPEYASWRRMRDRCSRPASGSYVRYGAAGISVCDRWQSSFENFLQDMGRKPGPEYTIDRIDNAIGYNPTNCRWSSPQEQARNRKNTVRIRINGTDTPLVEIAERLGLSKKKLYGRYRKNLDNPEFLLELERRINETSDRPR